MFKYIFVLFSLWLTLNHSLAANLPFGFAERILADSLNPVAMTIDHHDNIWIVEKHGQVRIYDPHIGLLVDPFIQLAVDDYNERGLLGIALHPDFDNNPYVYLYYTVPGGNHNRVSRFLANGSLAVPASEEIIMDLDTLSGFVHNGGAMLFGPDDKLFIATGEAAHPPFSQDLNSLHGKILRLNADGSIPSDNPFYAQLTGQSRAIWALGLRNPFAFSYNQHTEEFFVIDVGGGDFEEINALAPAMNYGWPIIEGPIDSQQAPNNYVDPIFAYDHDEGCSIVGAAFSQVPINHFPLPYEGHFFFADYCDGYIKSYDPISQSSQLFADQINRPLAIAFSQASGKMYYLTRAGIGGGSPADNTFTQQGQLWEVSYLGTGAPTVSYPPQSSLVSLGEDAQFQVRASGAYPLSYQWLQDGVPLSGKNDSLLILTAPPLADSGSAIQCIISNSEGADTSQVAILGVTSNQRPIPMILSPSQAFSFKAGDTISFSGKAIDPETGNLAHTSLSWLVVFHHDEHTHPGAGPFLATDTGSWIVPRVTETDTNVWYRLHLTATDEAGLSQSTSVDIYPQLALIKLSGPPGVLVNIDGRRRPLPHTLYSMVGLQRVIEAVPTTIVNDSLFRFLRWGNGANTTIWEGSSGPDGLSLSLAYEAFGLGNGEGVWASYYNDSSLGFETTPVLERPEPILSFLWGDASPEDDKVNEDYFTARWEGEIQAIFDETYTFHTRSDDGIRLWIGEQLLIDQWVPQAPTEHQASIQLEKAVRYPLRLEYFEMGGGAEMVLSWSSESTPKSLIPTRQLYYNAPIPPNTLSGTLWLDPNQNRVLEENESLLPHIPVLLYQANDNLIVGQSLTDEEGRFAFEDIPANNYYLQFLTSASGKALRGVADIDPLGRTEVFSFVERQVLDFSAAFVELDSSWFSPFPDLSIFPIPTTEKLTVAFAQLVPQEFELRLTDLMGKTCLFEKQKTQVGSNQYSLSLSGLSPGIYTLQLLSPHGRITQKIIKI